MKDFLSIDIDSMLSNSEVYDVLSAGLPDFSWRSGDSDAQGTYVSGMDLKGVRIQCWTGEKPMALSVSFRSAENIDEHSKERLVGVLMSDLLPLVGHVTRSDF